MKVNLSQVKSRIVGRGRKPYTDPELAAELAALDANDPDDALVWEKAQGDPTADDYGDHKARMRGRAESVAETLGRTISVQWTDAGECVISLRAKARKRK